MRVGVDRYLHRPGGEHAFAPLLEVPRATLLDLDLIQFLQSLEELLDARIDGRGAGGFGGPRHRPAPAGRSGGVPGRGGQLIY